jgi:hypothetical protein
LRHVHLQLPIIIIIIGIVLLLRFLMMSIICVLLLPILFGVLGYVACVGILGVVCVAVVTAYSRLVNAHILLRRQTLRESQTIPRLMCATVLKQAIFGEIKNV